MGLEDKFLDFTNKADGFINRVVGKVPDVKPVDYVPSRRTYVLKDFSIVSKATIEIYRCDSGILNDDAKLTCMSRMNVQVNPVQLDFSFGYAPQQKLMGASNVEDPNSVEFSAVDKSSTVIPLVFDIYDEYIARSGGMSGIGGLIGDMEGFSLANDQITALGALIKYARGVSPGVTTKKNSNSLLPSFIYFQWGDMESFGRFAEFKVNYTAFGSNGCPLKADAHITIDEPNIPRVSNGNATWGYWIKSRLGI